LLVVVVALPMAVAVVVQVVLENQL